MKEKTLNIVCFYWSGDRMDFPPYLAVDYVARLRNGVRRNLSLPHRFCCFTNSSVISSMLESSHLVETRELKALSWMGCLPKVMAFDPANGFRDRVLVFDIDNVIVGSLDDMASYSGPFCVRDGFRGQGPDGDMISFDPGSEWAAMIWNYFRNNHQKVEEQTGGRERFYYRSLIRELDVWQKVCPDQVFSYKRHCWKRNRFPKGARVVSFHGDPRPHVVKEAWVKEHWR